MITTTTISRIVVLALFFLCASPASAINLETVGVTYEIVEEDALAAFQERARQVDWNKVFGRKKTEKLIREYKPKGLVSLPRASEDRTFHVDMTYTLEFDIPDGKGGILYPRGVHL
jgi:conjugal transfer pilus assembly protein TraW